MVQCIVPSHYSPVCLPMVYGIGPKNLEKLRKKFKVSLLTGSPSLSYTLVSHWCIRKTRATSEKCHFFDFFLFLPMFAHGKILQNFFYGPILTFEAGKDPLGRGHQPPVEIFEIR